MDDPFDSFVCEHFQKADMAVIDLSITTQRQKAVDFTMPYMNTGKVLRKK